MGLTSMTIAMKRIKHLPNAVPAILYCIYYLALQVDGMYLRIPLGLCNLL